MGYQDRDWYRDHYKDKDKQRGHQDARAWNWRWTRPRVFRARRARIGVPRLPLVVRAFLFWIALGGAFVVLFSFLRP